METMLASITSFSPPSTCHSRCGLSVLAVRPIALHPVRWEEIASASACSMMLPARLELMLRGGGTRDDPALLLLRDGELLRDKMLLLRGGGIVLRDDVPEMDDRRGGVAALDLDLDLPGDACRRESGAASSFFTSYASFTKSTRLSSAF